MDKSMEVLCINRVAIEFGSLRVAGGMSAGFSGFSESFFLSMFQNR